MTSVKMPPPFVLFIASRYVQFTNLSLAILIGLAGKNFSFNYDALERVFVGRKIP
jgi:hypothetical protein